MIKNTFIGEKLLYAVRNVLFQFVLSDDDKTLLKELTSEVLAVIKKFFLPNLDINAPLGLQADSYFPLIAIQQMNPALAVLHIEIKDLQVQYLEQRMEILSGNLLIDKEIILQKLKNKTDSEEKRFINLLAYLHICSMIDAQLNNIKIIANTKEETEEEKKERLIKDSAE